MPTIRSEYSIEQFEEVLQRLAHKTAVDAVTNLNRGDVRIRIHGPRLTHVETSNYTFRFYASHMSYSVHPGGSYKHWWSFDVEEKEYLTSNHRTKISFEASGGEESEEDEKRIKAFIEGLMAEASMKPIPRFKLSKAQGAQRYLDLENKAGSNPA